MFEPFIGNEVPPARSVLGFGDGVDGGGRAAQDVAEVGQDQGAYLIDPVKNCQ